MDDHRLKAQGRKLKKLREMAQLSLVEVARVNRIDAALLNQVENGEKAAPVRLLSKLGKFYNVSMEEIEHDLEQDDVEPEIQDESPDHFAQFAQAQMDYYKYPINFKNVPEYRLFEELFLKKDVTFDNNDVEQILNIIMYIKKLKADRHS